MTINEIRNNYELVDLFCTLAEIPSPSLREEKVAEWIVDYCNKNGMFVEQDSYGNVYINIPATDASKQPMLLSAHMDVIGDDSPVVTYLDGDLIRAEERTLGADDKAGVANALYFATKLSKLDKKHGGLELFFTRDEESGMSGIHNADFKKLNSRSTFPWEGPKPSPAGKADNPKNIYFLSFYTHCYHVFRYVHVRIYTCSHPKT